MQKNKGPEPAGLKKIEPIVRKVQATGALVDLDFTDTAVAFAGKSDQELKKMAWLFGLMNKQWLVRMGSAVGLKVVKWRLPLADLVVRKTIFEQFCGGTTLLESQKTIDQLAGQRVLTILDYGAEGKKTEADFNVTMNETIRAIEFAAHNSTVPMVSTKITGMGRFGLLEFIQNGGSFNREQRQEYKNLLKRLDAVCFKARELDVAVLFDAEESWIQNTIDHLVNLMMRRYNSEKAIVFNTFQMYRTDRLQFLTDSFNLAREHGYFLGAKLVRGAYMEKERARAAARGETSPIYPSKQATDDAYNMALRFCLDNLEHIAVVNATHNAESNLLMAELVRKYGYPLDHPHLLSCQLYGMSDNLTFNLAAKGYKAAKYVPYGKVADVVPYLIRRAQENSAVTGDMSRELRMVRQEMTRRGLAK